MPIGTSLDLACLLESLPAHKRLEIAAQLIVDTAYDQAGRVDTGLVATLIRVAATLEKSALAH
ncbi:hypothetical protein [Rhodovulum sp. P5]|uniref:hypothetical protein n=1 Tax=Rhodovulum sp. P5 TaxID=1564506 RepID=UPI001560B706|nr:hypothetical protein [Rhodovulum sp. P5]